MHGISHQLARNYPIFHQYTILSCCPVRTVSLFHFRFAKFLVILIYFVDIFYKRPIDPPHQHFQNLFAKRNVRVRIFNQKHCLIDKGVSLNYEKSHKTASFIIWDEKNGLKLVNSIFYMERNFWTLPSSRYYCL